MLEDLLFKRTILRITRVTTVLREKILELPIASLGQRGHSGTRMHTKAFKTISFQHLTDRTTRSHTSSSKTVERSIL